MQALQNGLTLELLFEQIREARQYTQVPIVLMGYYNQVLQFGSKKFIDFCTCPPAFGRQASAAGNHSPNDFDPRQGPGERSRDVDGLILPDLPLKEYREVLQPLVEQADMRMTFLITPQTSEERIQQIDAASDGFIYVVSSSSITGSSTGISPEQVAYFQRIEALNLSSPRLIGFGISDTASFNTACQHAQGAIIGSAFIRALKGQTDVRATAKAFVQAIRG